MKLTMTESVSLDGVMQGLGGPDEDRRRLFADTGPDAALDLVDTRTTPSGATIQVFRPSGQPEYANVHREGKLATKLTTEEAR